MLKQPHRLRFALRTDGLIFVSILDRSTPISFVTQPVFFHKVVGISPRKTIGTVTVNDAQLLTLGMIPARNTKEVPVNDTRITISA
ncbi:hypothetical protein BK120_08195 [Paenibacillus sp. FSL A5-0031]|uniref:hypothetical protein n=1 Tax=Paenibacillus sp. FSL A5-0031 TaxID=1920420 RepID=UPI00096EB632|nr:hypothetical protein [Paenibacillus sp. FSL A5-0031]OME86893.1 hypothetical protein BK120_08195 [Paenibacillus sp. FSL A5-0031]